MIACRAHVCELCLDGQEDYVAVGLGGTITEDGTWDGHTIVCDPCYVAVMPFTESGRGLLTELAAAISLYRSHVVALRNCSDLTHPMRDLRLLRDAAQPGSHAYCEACALMDLVRAEQICRSGASVVMQDVWPLGVRVIVRSDAWSAGLTGYTHHYPEDSLGRVTVQLDDGRRYLARADELRSHA